jgi:hypothetical protein
LSLSKRLAFWTVSIGAGVVSIALMVAVVTLLEMATENSSPADLDRGHDSALCHRKRSAVLLTIGCAVATEHVRHFESRPIHFQELTNSAWVEWVSAQRQSTGWADRGDW